MEDDLYRLRIGDKFYPADFTQGSHILRVPGGWLFNLAHVAATYDPVTNATVSQGNITSTFVPYVEPSEELFKPKE